MEWRMRYTGFCCVWEIAIPNTKARPQLDLKGKIFPCFLPAFGFLQSLKVVAWTEKKKYFDLVLGNFNLSHRYLSRISYNRFQRKYLTIYWFMKQGMSEGPALLCGLAIDSILQNFIFFPEAQTIKSKTNAYMGHLL